MNEKTENMESPTLGCKLGKAYYTLLNQLTDSLRQAGLSISANEYLILRAVFSHEGMQQCEIADIIGKDKASVCRGIAELRRRGFLHTESVSHKCLRIYPTAEAKKIEPKICEVARQRHAALAELCEPSELQIFSRILDRILKNE